MIPTSSSGTIHYPQPGMANNLDGITEEIGYFGPGVYYIPWSCHAQLPASVKWVYLAPGAFVKGAFQFVHDNQGVYKFTGFGVVSGEKYLYEADTDNEYQHRIDSECHGSCVKLLRFQVSNTWRWSKVPFYLRTGKRMQRQSSKIVIEFANPPFPLVPETPGGVANRLVIELQPEEAIKLQIMAKQPGSGMQMQQVELNLDLHEAFQQRRAEAYERLLIDVVCGRLTHFMRRDELEAAWQWADPIINGWGVLGEKPHAYPAGSWGPAEAFALLARDGFSRIE